MNKILVLILLFFNISNVFAQKLIKHEDEFTGIIKINTPLNTEVPIQVIKIIDGTYHFYYLSVFSESLTCSIDAKNLYILFTDGTILKKPCDIDIPDVVNLYDNIYGYRYHAFVELTADDLVLLSSKTIKKWRIYIYDFDCNGMEYINEFPKYVNDIILSK